MGWGGKDDKQQNPLRNALAGDTKGKKGSGKKDKNAGKPLKKLKAAALELLKDDEPQGSVLVSILPLPICRKILKTPNLEVSAVCVPFALATFGLDRS